MKVFIFFLWMYALSGTIFFVYYLGGIEGFGLPAFPLALPMIMPAPVVLALLIGQRFFCK